MLWPNLVMLGTALQKAAIARNGANPAANDDVYADAKDDGDCDGDGVADAEDDGAGEGGAATS